MEHEYRTDVRSVLLALYDAIPRLGAEIIHCDSKRGYIKTADAELTVNRISDGTVVQFISENNSNGFPEALFDEVEAILHNAQ